MTVRKIIFATAIIVTTLGVSCRKEKVEEIISQKTTEETNNVEKPYIYNGRMVFKNKESFEKHINWLYENQRDEELINSFNKNLGYTSMFDIYQRGMKINDPEEKEAFRKEHKRVFLPVEFDNSIIYELQASVFISKIANEDGLYQIGNEIHRSTFYSEIIIEDGDETQIPLILEYPSRSVANENIKVVKTLIENEEGRGHYSYKTVYHNWNRRVVARLYKKKDGDYYSYSAKTTHQRRRSDLLSWYSNDMGNVSLFITAGAVVKYKDGTSQNLPEEAFTGWGDEYNVGIFLHHEDKEIDVANSSVLLDHRGIAVYDGTTSIKWIRNNQMIR